MREKEWLELYPNEMNEDSETSEKDEKEIIGKTKKEKNRNHVIQCAEKCAGRGANGSLKNPCEKGRGKNNKNKCKKKKK